MGRWLVCWLASCGATHPCQVDQEEELYEWVSTLSEDGGWLFVAKLAISLCENTQRYHGGFCCESEDLGVTDRTGH